MTRPTQLTLATADTPGAVAILHLHGEGVADTLTQLTGKQDWPNRRAMLCSFADIDEGLAIRIGDASAQLMPHGGPRVVHKLIEHLTKHLSCTYDSTPDTRSLYPEADSPIQADVLDAIARAASPAAIDLLAAQPKLWRGLLQRAGVLDEQHQAILYRSKIVDQLIMPPTVVVVGPANAGKSTLTNSLMGKAVSIVADLPGTTRDWVGGLVEISPSPASPLQRDGESSKPQPQAIAVHWLDTPGLRDSDDRIEQQAIALAKRQIERADLLIAMRGVDQDWPNTDALPRHPGLWLVNKDDDAALAVSGSPGIFPGESPQSPLAISAIKGQGLDRLQEAVLRKLQLNVLPDDLLWAFCPVLRSFCGASDAEALRRYLGL